MIYITGDTHGMHDGEKLWMFNDSSLGKTLTKNDYVIVAGDFGFIWEMNEYSEKLLNQLNELNYTLLFVDGNHENFDILNDYSIYPVVEMFGGHVQKIRPHVIHLMRGEIYEIDGKSIFTFGGAYSVDKAWRREGLSWWKAEQPNVNEMNKGIANLAKVNDTVDIVITHDAPSFAVDQLAVTYHPEVSVVKTYLNHISKFMKYDHWYCGHHHVDKGVKNNFSFLYNIFVSANDATTVYDEGEW